ncbi:hypothetical protein E2C01_082367 [Portunus trituberculatus]|uniref:Uncharacterized protein n=1 Tax=Portunus trituberculatus TaxID=210409 RepID=A0A5B7IYA6_PORTR|nr:hypothetical protein [Portunus trituberculatus]
METRHGTEGVTYHESQYEQLIQVVSSDSFQYAAQVASETDTGAELKGLEAAKTETHVSNEGESWNASVKWIEVKYMKE